MIFAKFSILNLPKKTLIRFFSHINGNEASVNPSTRVGRYFFGLSVIIL